MEGFQELFDPSKLPRHKVELHVHLEGSVRIETIWNLAQKKGIPLAESMEQLREKCHITKPSTLENFLQPIAMYLPVIAGDADAVERIAYEFCEDAVKEGLLYVEVRYSPHLMSSTHGELENKEHARTLAPADVVVCVNKGLDRGRRDFGIRIKSILCSIRGRPGWSTDVARLCYEFRDHGVVGMDIAGDDKGKNDTSEEVVEAFKLAAKNGTHRTVHAGEVNPASEVKFALDELLAERIGHGYHVVEDPLLYARCLETQVHIETCPHSSLLTGAVMDRSVKHPIVRFVEDWANFSINRDDPTVTQLTLKDDYDVLRGMGLSDVHFARANFNAAHSSFLPEEEKKALLRQLRMAYGIDRY